MLYHFTSFHFILSCLVLHFLWFYFHSSPLLPFNSNFNSIFNWIGLDWNKWNLSFILVSFITLFVQIIFNMQFFKDSKWKAIYFEDIKKRIHRKVCLFVHYSLGCLYENYQTDTCLSIHTKQIDGLVECSDKLLLISRMWLFPKRSITVYHQSLLFVLILKSLTR